MESARLGNTGLRVSKLCFGNPDVRGWRRALQGHHHRCKAGADELVKSSIDGGISFFDTADNYTQPSCQRHIVRKLITSARRNPCLSCRTSIPGALRCW
jgi:aryl-alcohol dehydrogenase-like predicted oxidoreductase